MSPTVLPSSARLVLPIRVDQAEITVGRKKLRLTALDTPLWPELNVTKRDVLQYYIGIAPVLLPHLKNRPIAVDAARAPRPSWVRTIGDCPIVQDLGSLLWILDLDCLDLRPSAARSDDASRPDYVEFDVDPAPGRDLRSALDAALRARDALAELDAVPYVKTSGSRGLHLCVPIKRGLVDEQIRRFAETISATLPGARPARRSLVAAYSVRRHRLPCVSAPVMWPEVERGFRIEDFRLDTIGDRLRDMGDLWKPLTLARGRVDLARLAPARAASC